MPSGASWPGESTPRGFAGPRDFVEIGGRFVKEIDAFHPEDHHAAGVFVEGSLGQVIDVDGGMKADQGESDMASTKSSSTTAVQTCCRATRSICVRQGVHQREVLDVDVPEVLVHKVVR